MKPTHQKRVYKAEAIQWDGNNFDEIAALFPEVCTHSTEYLMIRHCDGVSTLQRGSSPARTAKCGGTMTNSSIYGMR